MFNRLYSAAISALLIASSISSIIACSTSSSIWASMAASSLARKASICASSWSFRNLFNSSSLISRGAAAAFAPLLASAFWFRASSSLCSCSSSSRSWSSSSRCRASTSLSYSPAVSTTFANLSSSVRSISFAPSKSSSPSCGPLSSSFPSLALSSFSVWKMAFRAIWAAASGASIIHWYLSIWAMACEVFRDTARTAAYRKHSAKDWDDDSRSKLKESALDMQKENTKSSQREKARSLTWAGITWCHTLKASSLTNSATTDLSLQSTSRRSGGRDSSERRDLSYRSAMVGTSDSFSRVSRAVLVGKCCLMRSSTSSWTNTASEEGRNFKSQSGSCK
mmetsp:Transcript_24858/g.34181  ORF Transcript_24858/g.34181 Transcript_24858/m.34181 type:complete len:337 (+) Transcript_24858:453-1463(+)